MQSRSRVFGFLTLVFAVSFLAACIGETETPTSQQDSDEQLELQSREVPSQTLLVLNSDADPNATPDCSAAPFFVTHTLGGTLYSPLVSVFSGTMLKEKMRPVGKIEAACLDMSGFAPILFENAAPIYYRMRLKIDGKEQVISGAGQCRAHSYAMPSPGLWNSVCTVVLDQLPEGYTSGGFSADIHFNAGGLPDWNTRGVYTLRLQR